MSNGGFFTFSNLFRFLFFTKWGLILTGAVIAFFVLINVSVESYMWLIGWLVRLAVIAGVITLLYMLYDRRLMRASYRRLMRLTGRMQAKGTAGALHGSAAFASEQDLKVHGLRAKNGFILGRYNDRLVRFGEIGKDKHRPGHLITFAPTRSGKGVGHVIPNLLDHKGSVVVNDIKGENYAITARHRATFTKVFTFAPFSDVGSNCLNPLDFVRVGTEYELDDVNLITDMIFVQSENSDPFWELSAKELITGIIMYVVTSSPPPLRNLAEMRYLLMQDKEDFDMMIENMTKSENEHVRRRAAAFSATQPKVMASIMTVAKSQTGVWDSPMLKAVTSTSDFDPAVLKDEPTSFYIIIPPEYMETYKPVVRLLTGVTIAALIRNAKRPKLPVLYLIDEFAALGYMQNIETGIGYLAGYGVSLWMFLQDLSQLKANYEKWESFIANCSVRMAFGTNDIETAKTLSEMLGETTVTSESKEVRLGWVKNTASSKTISGQNRSLMTADEVMRLDYDSQLIFVQGAKPIVAQKIFYFKDKAFDSMHDEWNG